VKQISRRSEFQRNARHYTSEGVFVATAERVSCRTEVHSVCDHRECMMARRASDLCTKKYGTWATNLICLNLINNICRIEDDFSDTHRWNNLRSLLIKPDYGRRDPPSWPCDILLSAKVGTMPTNGSFSVGIVRLWTKGTELLLLFFFIIIPWFYGIIYAWPEPNKPMLEIRRRFSIKDFIRQFAAPSYMTRSKL
jgi:hypothetical protein